MNPSPMVDQVNRMVGNILAWSGEIALPGVGSLFVERRPASRVTKRTVIPPCRVVGFTSQMQGALLTDEIARVAQCDAAQAQDIYDRWLARVLQDQVLTIEGVGVLKFKNFTLDQSFDRLLNPQGHEPVRVRSRSSFDWTLWFGAVVIVCVVVAGIWIWVSDRNMERPWLNRDVAKGQIDAKSNSVGINGADSAISQDVIAQLGATQSPSSSEVTVNSGAIEGEPEVVVGAQKPAAAVAQAPSTAAVEHAAKSASQAATPSNSATEELVAEFVTGRLYVVLGVFSTEQNARRAIAEAAKKGDMTGCSIFRFGGSKWMVSPFNSASSAECASFIAQNGESFPGMWSYTAK